MEQADKLQGLPDSPRSSRPDPEAEKPDKDAGQAIRGGGDGECNYIFSLHGSSMEYL